MRLIQFGADAVHGYLLKSPAWVELCKWRGSESLHTMQTLVQEQFPTIWQEIEGLAKGLNLSVEDTFMWNSRGDLWAMAPDSCSTVIQLLPEPRITHNEDGDPGFYGHCGVIQFTPDNSTAFTSFVYPGSIPGHTFATNEHDLVMTVNNIRALHALPGTPRMVLCRAIMDCPTVADAVNLLRTHSRSGAFHLNLGDASGIIHSVEFNQERVSDEIINEPNFHANHAIHPTMRDYPQIITGSSGYRQVQGDKLIFDPSTPIDALVILGCQAHDRFPIYRRADDDTDNENTIATADFIYKKDGLHWSVYDGPLKAPLYTFISQVRT